MLFNSINYVIFLPLVLILYYVIKPKYRNIFLLIASYFFYMCWIPKYAVLILFSTILTYFTSKLIAKAKTKRGKKIYVAIAIIINIGILFIFKYFNFFNNTLSYLLSTIGITLSSFNFSLLLPVGISFYTFQTLSYVIDVYRGDIKEENSFTDYALFVSFFPQLVAGPIERANNLLPQFKEIHIFNYKKAIDGFRIILIGMVKKVVIADTLAIIVNAVYNSPKEYSGLTLIFATILFSIQIYCDFSGYSDIAVGSAKLLGFNLMENFKTPYLATSIADFWSRWHISLSTWLKDYIYIPLGGNRKGFIRKCINLIITFLVSGIWHGAKSTYIVWGLLHGIFRVIQEIIRKYIKNKNYNNKYINYIINGIKIVITYCLVCFAWIFFRASSLTSAILIIKNLFVNISVNSFIYDINSIISTVSLGTVTFSNFIIYLITIIVVMFIIFSIYRRYKLNDNYLSNIFIKMPVYLRRTVYYLLAMIVIILFLIQNGTVGQTSQFIYFQF